MKFLKFKKIAFEAKKMEKELTVSTKKQVDKHGSSRRNSRNNSTEKQKLICEHPRCIGEKVSLVEIRKEFDKLLIENAMLRKKIFNLNTCNKSNKPDKYSNEQESNKGDLMDHLDK